MNAPYLVALQQLKDASVAEAVAYQRTVEEGYHNPSLIFDWATAHDALVEASRNYAEASLRTGLGSADRRGECGCRECRYADVLNVVEP